MESFPYIPLWHSFATNLEDAFIDMPSFKKKPEKVDEALVLDSSFDTCHEQFVVNCIEGTHDTLPISKTFRSRLSLPERAIRSKGKHFRH